jgi:methanogenic corrinoid protein MtbC1
MVGMPFSTDRDFSGWVGADNINSIGSAKLTPVYKGYAAQKPVRPALALAKMVESEIIPRLMLAHNEPVSGLARLMPELAEFQDHLGAETTEAFCRMALAKESEALLAFVGTLLQRGLTLQAIYVDLIIPTAHLLGRLWDEDEASFTDVTIGLGRLQQVVRVLGWKTPVGDDDGSARSALFMAAPGELHTFGLFLIDDFFRRAGWRTWIEDASTAHCVEQTVETHWFDLFGMSLGAETQLKTATSVIQAIRKASRNPDIFILVGGRIFDQRPELVSIVGADAMAATGCDALILADKAVRRVASGV